MKTLLGTSYFEFHDDERIRHADGIINLRVLPLDQFLEEAEAIKKRII